jgi:hypothetical protein
MPENFPTGHFSVDRYRYLNHGQGHTFIIRWPAFCSLLQPAERKRLLYYCAHKKMGGFEYKIQNKKQTQITKQNAYDPIKTDLIKTTAELVLY